MDRIKTYLGRALEMTNSCVVVMKYTKDEPVTRTKLEFISENVQQLGMNLDSLKGGFRLPKDYIHPEDRNGFIDAVSIAAETQTDFTYRVRLVGDDGVIRNVDVSSQYMDFDADYYLIEYVFHEIILQKEDLTEGQKKKKDSAGAVITKDVFGKDDLSEIFGIFANSYGLYSTVVDQDGHSLLPPVGPEAYLGHYYDMFERPENQELFDTIKRSALMQDQAVYMELENGNPDSRVSAVPLMVNGVHLATWMLCAHDKSQSAALRIASRVQCRLAELVSGYIQRTVISSRRNQREKELEKLLEFEQQQKAVISKLNPMIHSDDTNSIHMILQEAKNVLDVDYAFLMMRNGSTGSFGTIEDYVSFDGTRPKEINFEAFAEDERKNIAEEGYVVDQKSMTNRIRVSVFQGFARAAIIYPIRINEKSIGKIVFLETRRERIWTRSEIVFAEMIGQIMTEHISYRKGMGNGTGSGRDLLELFHQLSIHMFIKAKDSGRVLFSNTALNRQLGFDFVGQDSRRIVPEGKEEFESYPGTLHEKPVEKKGIRKWRRYINEFSGIYDVTEIPVEWIDGSEAVAVLLRIAQD